MSCITAEAPSPYAPLPTPCRRRAQLPSTSRINFVPPRQDTWRLIYNTRSTAMELPTGFCPLADHISQAVKCLDGQEILHFCSISIVNHRLFS
ncbi:hypothetical protein IG631_02741 [Alternaria alternata]|nr:hypothetical protein IG631_02741 [Alternaria alternata]